MFGEPSPESLARHPSAPGGLTGWWEGHGWPAGTRRSAGWALTAAALGGGAAVVGAFLPWVNATLTDHGSSLLSVTIDGTDRRLPGYAVAGLGLCVVALAAVTRGQPARRWLGLVLAAVGAGVTAVVVTSADEPGLTRDRLLRIPLFLADTSGVAAHATLALGWWVALAGGVVAIVTGVAAFAVLAPTPKQ